MHLLFKTKILMIKKDYGILFLKKIFFIVRHNKIMCIFAESNF